MSAALRLDSSLSALATEASADLLQAELAPSRVGD
jgi:hypothetical protein